MACPSQSSAAGWLGWKQNLACSCWLGLLAVRRSQRPAPHFAPVLAEMARRHPQLHIQTGYSDRFVDLITEGYDCAIRVGYLQDSNPIARCIGPINDKLVASPGYIKAHGSPKKPQELIAHQALMRGQRCTCADHDGVSTTPGGCLHGPPGRPASRTEDSGPHRTVDRVFRHVTAFCGGRGGMKTIEPGVVYIRWYSSKKSTNTRIRAGMVVPPTNTA